jgi:hypothetical protein
MNKTWNKCCAWKLSQSSVGTHHLLLSVSSSSAFSSGIVIVAFFQQSGIVISYCRRNCKRERALAQDFQCIDCHQNLHVIDAKEKKF